MCRAAICAGLMLALGVWTCSGLHAQQQAAPSAGDDPAADNTPADDAPKPRSAATILIERLIRLPDGIKLSPEQQASVSQIRKEEGPKLLALVKRLNNSITPEQKQAAADARKRGLAEGLEGEKLEQAIAAAVPLTGQQKAERARIEAAWQQLQKQILKRLEALLTPAQKAELLRLQIEKDQSPE